jgi:hypothetical protein
VRIKFGVISPMITFSGGFGVSSVESADSIINVRVGSFSRENAGSNFDPIYSSCYSIFLLPFQWSVISLSVF